MALTPAEIIILRHYAANPFMFNQEDEKFYSPKAKKEVLEKIKTAIEKQLFTLMNGNVFLSFY